MKTKEPYPTMSTTTNETTSTKTHSYLKRGKWWKNGHEDKGAILPICDDSEGPFLPIYPLQWDDSEGPFLPIYPLQWDDSEGPFFHHLPPSNQR